MKSKPVKRKRGFPVDKLLRQTQSRLEYQILKRQRYLKPIGELVCRLRSGDFGRPDRTHLIEGNLMSYKEFRDFIWRERWLDMALPLKK